ncbi:MAG: hypothetical protein RBT71_08400 [Flavobacteriales bacterium]|jgi:hypothetical protein|nr:hypothetical protein [Flavobacteriales bacterium]
MPGIFLAIGHTALLLYLMRRMRFYRCAPGLAFGHVAALFLLMIGAGAAMAAIYTWAYPVRAHADVFKYFDDSAVMHAALWERPGDFLRMLFGVGADGPWFVERYYDEMNSWLRQFDDGLYNDAHTMVRASALVRIISFGRFPVHVVYAAFAGLTGLLALHRTFAGLLPGRERAVAVACLLSPSVLLWAGSPIKECLLFLGLGMLLWHVCIAAEHGPRLRTVVAVALAVLLLMHIKAYVLLCLLPAGAVLAVGRATGRPVLAFVLVGVAGLAALAAIGTWWPEWNVLEVIARKHRDFIGHAQATGAGSFVVPPALEPTVASFVMQAPYALYMALVGPLMHPAGGLLGLPALLENLLLLAVPIVCLLHRRPWHAVDGSLLAALLAYCLAMLLLIGYTTPVMGVLVRYRVPVLPFLFIAALLVLDRDRVLARWPRLRPFIVP